MDTHPVPQNVTSFEFHLVGDMTLKQFGYLASGITVAYLTFIFLFAAAPYFAIPIMVVSSLLGIALAFLPIADRPLDYWLVAFFKAVYSPTQRMWKATFLKEKVDPKNPTFQNRLNLYLENLKPVSNSPLPQTLLPVVAPSEPVKPVVSPEPEKPSKIKGLSRLLASQENPPASPLKPAQTITQTPPPATTPHPVPPLPQIPQNLPNPQMNQLLEQNRDLQSQLLFLQQQLAQFRSAALVHQGITAQSIAPQQVAPRPVQTNLNIPRPLQKPVATAVPAQSLPKAKENLTNQPNIISGIVLDQNHRPIDNVILIIADQNNIPVRALKTSRLGQFTGATPLPNGVYTLTLEKDHFEFTPTRVELNGQVLPTISITGTALTN